MMRDYAIFVIVSAISGAIGGFVPLAFFYYGICF